MFKCSLGSSSFCLSELSSQMSWIVRVSLVEYILRQGRHLLLQHTSSLLGLCRRTVVTWLQVSRRQLPGKYCRHVADLCKNQSEFFGKKEFECTYCKAVFWCCFQWVFWLFDRGFFIKASIYPFDFDFVYCYCLKIASKIKKNFKIHQVTRIFRNLVSWLHKSSIFWKMMNKSFKMKYMY